MFICYQMTFAWRCVRYLNPLNIIQFRIRPNPFSWHKWSQLLYLSYRTWEDHLLCPSCQKDPLCRKETGNKECLWVTSQAQGAPHTWHGWNTAQPNGLMLEQHEHLLLLPRGRLIEHQTVLQSPLAANPLLYHNLPPPQILKGYSHKKKWWGLPCLLPWNLQLTTVFSGMENASLVRSQKHFSAFLTSVEFIIWATVVKLLLHDS